MKNNLISISLATATAPIVQEARGKDWIEYGTDEWKNLYPQFLIDLYYNSSTHSAIINATAEMIAGEDLYVENEDENLEAYVRLKKFLRHANGKESLHQVVKKVAFDFKLQGAYALHIIWNQERTEIAEVHHVPVERVRSGIPNPLGQIDSYFISSNWSDVRNHPPHEIKAFNRLDRTSASQLIYTGSYSPNMDIYHTPDYIAGCNWALVDQRVAEFHLNNIQNGFSGSYFISFANGIPSQSERFQIEQSLTEKFAGAKNSGKFILTFSDDKTRTPEITPIQVSEADKTFLALQELLVTNICSAHRITSKTLMGIDTTNGFSSNADELRNASNFYHNTVIRGFQTNILNTLQTIFSVNNMDLEVDFEQLKPITVEFDSSILKEVMTQEEIRESLQLPPLVLTEKNPVTDALSTMSPLLANKVLNNLTLDETRDLIGLPSIDPNELPQEDTGDVNMCRTKEPIFKRNKKFNTFNKIGTVDGKPVFSTIEEAVAHAKTLGCEGYHEHDLNGTVSYMACEQHSEATDLTEVTELTKFIQEYGEDILADWELIDEENSSGEHQDFDFEKTLNEVANEKTMLASTGKAIPSRKSEQDGQSKKTGDYFRVRYVYEQDNFLQNKSGDSRKFCKQMMAANKLYRKEDIINMGSKVVNAGWGPKGADTYSIWLADQHNCANSLKTNKLEFYKGGGNCHHFWLRKIYKTTLGQSKTTKIEDADVIGYTKARSEGFTPKRNDSLVATPPKRMANKGFLPK
jgi:hypothetical protein